MINLGKIKFSWKGEWTPTTAYTKDDVVKYGASSYVCVTAHTSGANWAANAAKFEEMTLGVKLDPVVYDNGTTYLTNTIVKYNESLYISKQDTTGNLPTNATYWDFFTGSMAQEQIYALANSIIPALDGTIDLGTDANRFKDIWLTGQSIHLGEATISADATGVTITNGDGSVVTISGNGLATTGDVQIFQNTIKTTYSNSDLELDAAGTGEVHILTNTRITGDLNVTGTIDIGGDITIGGDPLDSVSVQADFTSDLIPNASLTYDLGETGKRWNNLFIDRIDTTSLAIQNSTLTTNATNKDLNISLNTTGTVKINGQDLLSHDDHVWYVSDGNGLDTNDGLRTWSPFRTLAKAFSVADVGDTVIIAPGTYEETFPLTIPVGVNVKGSGLRETTVRPTLATNNKDAFLLSGETVLSDLTIKDMFYDAVNDTGYAFRFQNTAVITTRSPYVERVTVLNRGSVTTPTDPYGFASGDAGRGALIDGAKVSRGSLEAAMLFNECTFIVPNSRALIMTNGARSEWLTCFTYFADLHIEGKVGALGRGGDGKTYITFGGVSGAGFQVGETIRVTSTDGSTVIDLVVNAVSGSKVTVDGKFDLLEGEDFTPGAGGGIAGLTSGTTATSITRYDRAEFGAELRAISGANIYGNQGIKADGDDVTMQLMGWNFAYIGTGADLTNDKSAVVQANEVIEINSGRVFYNSVDQGGNYRVGDLFTVDFATGNVTFQAPNFNVSSLTGITFTNGAQTTVVDPTQVSTGNIVIAGNSITTTSGTLTLDPSGSEVINLNGSTNITGNLGVSGDVTIGGNITIGNQTLDTVTVVADFTSNLIPDVDQTYDLGTGAKAWRTIYVDKVDNGQMTFKDNRIETTQSNSNLEINAAGTGTIVLESDVTTTNSTFNLVDTTATTVNFAGAATTIDIGATTGTMTINNNKVVLNSTGTLKLPVGNVSQRGTGVTGEVRFNTELSSFEGYANGNWQGLGGVKSVDGLTYIIPETSPAASNGELEFYAEDAAGTGTTKVAGLNRTRLTVPIATASTTTTDGALIVTGGVGIGGTVNVGTNLNVTGDVAVNGGDLTTTATTFNLVNANATTVNLASAGTAVNIGAASGTTTIKNNLQVDGATTITGNVTNTGNLTVTGNFTVNGTTTTINSNTITVDDKNLALASVAAVTGLSGTIASTATTTTVTGIASTTGLIPGQALTKTTGAGAFGGTTIITSVDSATQITITSTTANTTGAITFNAGGPTNATADGGGITVLGASNKLFQYDLVTDSWLSSETLNLALGKGVEFNGTTIITPDVVTPTNFTLGTALSTVTVADEIFVTNNLVTNGDVISDQLTQNLYPDVVSTINFGTVATTVNIGATTGTTTIKNNTDINGVVRIGGNSISAKPTTTVIASGIIGNFTNAAQSGQTTTTDGMDAQFEIEFEFDTGNIVRLTLISGGKGWVANATPFVGDLLYIKGSALGGLDGGAVGVLPATGNDIIIAVTAVNTPKVVVATVPNDNTGVITAFAYQGSAPIIAGGTTTFDLINQYVETVNFASDATTIQIGAVDGLGAASGTTTIRNNLTVNGDTIVSAVSTGAPGVIRSNTPQMDVFNTVSTIVNFAGQADTVNIGSAFGVTTINNTLEVPTGIVADLKGSVFGDFSSKIIDGITGDVTANDLQVNGSATFAFDLLVQGGDIVTDQTTFNLINDTTTTLNIGGAASSLTLGATIGTLTLRNASVQIDGDLNVSGGDITTGAAVFNFVNSGALELYMGGSAQTVGIGSSLGTTTINNDVVAALTLQVNGDTLKTVSTTFNLINDTAQTVNAFGAATVINIGEITGTTTISSAITDLTGDLKVQGGDIISDQASFNLLTTPTTINFADSATALQIGAASGTTNIRNDLMLDGDLEVTGGDIFSTQATFNLLNTDVGTINLGGNATQVNIGFNNGVTNIKHNANIFGVLTIGSADSTVATINGADTSFYLANTTVENLYMGGAATVVEIGSTTGTTTVNNDLVVNGTMTFDQDILVKGGDITTDQATFNLINTVASTVNLAGAATTINIGSVNGTTTVNNNLKVQADLEVVGSDITTNQASFNLLNSNATTINFAGDGTAINIGSATGDTTVKNNLTIDGITTVKNHILPDVNVAYDLGSSTNRFRDLYLSGGTIDLAGGTISFDGSQFNFQGGTNVGTSIDTQTVSFDLLNTVAQTINFGGEATIVNIGALSGSTNIRNNLAVAGQITVGSSDSSTSTLAVSDTSFFLANTTAETIYFGGAATSVNVGAVGGTTTFNTGITVSGDTLLEQNLTVNGNLTLTSLNTTGENNDFVISPQGTGRVIIEPQGGLILNPTVAGSMDNVNIGTTVRGTAKVTTLAANGQVTLTAGIASVDSTTGTLVVQGGLGIGENLNVEGNISANQLTLRGRVLFENELAVESGGTGAGQFTAKGILYGNSTQPLQSTAASDVATPYTGTNQQTSNAILTTTANGTPVWSDVIDCGTF